jgi:hypothetical protein
VDWWPADFREISELRIERAMEEIRQVAAQLEDETAN